MNDLNLLFTTQNENKWIDILPKYQRDTVIELIKNMDLSEAASIWLEATVDNNQPFGSEKQEKDKRFFDVLKNEIHKLLCGDPEYKQEREELKQEINKENNKTALISIVSATIGAKIGLAATFLAPAVVIIFIMISKVTLNTWCQL